MRAQASALLLMKEQGLSAWGCLTLDQYAWLGQNIGAQEGMSGLKRTKQVFEKKEDTNKASHEPDARYKKHSVIRMQFRF